MSEKVVNHFKGGDVKRGHTLVQVQDFRDTKLLFGVVLLVWLFHTEKDLKSKNVRVKKV